jgi:hypothetical protein
VTQVTFLSGIRGTVTKPQHRIKLSGHALFGGVYSNDGLVVDDNKDWAFAFGGTIEFPLAHDKAPFEGWGIRLQVDYVTRANDVRDDFPRFSGGVVYRFPY